MRRTGYIHVKLADSVETRAPAHLDVLCGACRHGSTVDAGGRIDRAILSRVSGIRASCPFHSRASLGVIGERNARYDDLEQTLGLPRVLSVQLSEPDSLDDVVAELRASGAIEWAMAEPLASAPLHVATPLAVDDGPSIAAFERVGASLALSIETGSPDIAVAIIDTGVALGHTEFHGRLRLGVDTVDLGMGSIAEGVTLVGDSLGPDFCARDETGHGSHVAGIVGALGVNMPPGVGGEAFLIPVRALAAALVGGSDLVGVGGLANIDAAIKLAVDRQAKVLNMSFGTPAASLDPNNPPPHTDVMRYADAYGVIMVAAIGNSGREEAFYPAADPRAIAVGSMNLDGNVSEFSTRGDHIALCAPGEHVLSAGLNDGYRASTGTSHAAPFVAGAVALLAARAKARGHDLSAAEAKEVLTASAEGAQRGHTSEAGYGMLDIPAAIRRLDASVLQIQEAIP